MTQEKGSSQFKYLFTPLKVGPITVRNRVVNPGHTLRYGENGLPSEKHLYYYIERAKGGAGLQIMESTSVHPSSIGSRGGAIVNVDDRIVPVYKRISESVHQYGGRILAELTHAGRQTGPMADPQAIWAPSPVPIEIRHGSIPHEIEPEQIAEVVECFSKASLRCIKGGLDGVEIQAAHGSLIHQFLSPLTNRRSDEYGGSLENRMRFALEVLRSAREAVGREHVVGMRINGSDLTEGGLTITDMQEVAWKLEQTGLVDYFSVSVAHYSDWLGYARNIPDMSFRPGVWAHLAGNIKKVVKIPVFCIGRVNHPVVAEEILASGQADMVGMVRALIADPHLPNKAREGRIEDIRLCVGAMEACVSDPRGYSPPVSCVYNPVTSREKEWATIAPATTKKKVVVVGGGPGGMECARVAALCGHRVTLLEKGTKLGGQVLTAAKAPLREEFGIIADYLSLQVNKAGVDVRLGVEATPENIVALHPDAVVVATGSVPVMPDIPQTGDMSKITVDYLLEGRAEAGQRVLIADEAGDQLSFSAAEYLATKGRRVTLITRLVYPGIRMQPTTWRVQYQRLLELGVELVPLTSLKSLEERKAVTYNVFTNAVGAIEGVDTVVFSVPRRANDDLYRSLKGKIGKLCLIGDAMAPRGVKDATYEGHKVAREI
ncbi:MAG: FAD-dependent oxidoreductase [Chloroflexi bacterium]|nr:FAD-dependent oxidoreductase [Chloroflexota bacterium]